MAFTAREVIAAARAWSPAFDEATQPNVPLFDFLTSVVRTERRQLMAFAPELLLSQEEVLLPLTVFTDGAPLANAEMIHTVTAISDEGGEVRGDPVALVPLEHMQDMGVWPAATWIGGDVARLYLKGAALDWRGYARLLVNYVAVPASIASLDDDIDLPGAYREVCVGELAMFMAIRAGKDRVGQQQVGYLSARLGGAREAAMLSIAAQRSGEVFKIRELF